MGLINFGRVIGEDGTNGTSADISSITAVGLAAGETPTATLGGTSLARTIQFGIPAGAQGAKGTDGTNGTNGTSADITEVSATALTAGANPTVTLGGTAQARTFQFGIPIGAKGADGKDGTNGTNGNNGADGTSIVAVEAPDKETALSLSLSNPNNIYFVKVLAT